MSTPEKRKVWLVLDHPQQFAIALGIVSHGGREKFIFNLLISPHSYWSKVDINLYKHQFDKIHFLERPDYTWHPIRVLRMIFQILRLKKKIAQLGIPRNDIIIGLSIFHYLENIVLSMYPGNLKIAIMPLVVYEECIREMDRNSYRNTVEGWLANWIVEPITGLHRTYCRVEKPQPLGYWWIRYRKSLLDIFNKVVVLGDFPSEKSYFGDNIITMPFPYVLAFDKAGVENDHRDKKPQKVVFFGAPFKGGIAGITEEIWVKNVNAYLSFLREKYGAAYKLVYRPHPINADEIEFLNLDQFEIENDGMLAELYFYKNIEDIHAVFSVASTTCRSAFDFFINAYAFLNIFPYNDKAKNHFRETMGNVPDDFYINDLSITPNRYIKTEDINVAIKKCRDVLDVILQKSEKR